MSFIKQILSKHWTVEKKLKDEKQEELEKWLCLYLPIIPFNRWVLFPAAFLIQFCCGSLYAWSVFNHPIDNLIYNDPTADMAVITFYLAVVMFGCTTMVMGPWLDRNGPRRGVMLGSSMIFIGHVLSAVSIFNRSIIGIYIGYGAFVGFGFGVNYISPVSALQKWFPDYRGIASGFAVGGFGAGSVVWSKVYLPLIDGVGLAPAFVVLGSVLFWSMLFCTIALRTPPNNFDVNTYSNASKEGSGEKETDLLVKSTTTTDLVVEVASTDSKAQSRSYTLIQGIRSPDFFFLYIVFFANQTFGLVALSRLANMCTELFDQSEQEGSTVVSINGIFNCCGRLVLPMFSDLAVKLLGNRCNPALPRKVTFFVTLATQLVIISILPSLIGSQNYTGFRYFEILALVALLNPHSIVIWILTACYGAGFGTIPALLTNLFGTINIGAMHGIILTAWSIGGVAGGLGFTANYNKFKDTDIRKAYEYNFTWILAVIVVGLGLLWFVRTDSKDRASEGYRFSIFGKKVFHFCS